MGEDGWRGKAAGQRPPLQRPEGDLLTSLNAGLSEGSPACMVNPSKQGCAGDGRRSQTPVQLSAAHSLSPGALVSERSTV